MQDLNKLGQLYPCLRVDKSGLVVALNHDQWELAEFLLCHDGGTYGFLDATSCPAGRSVAVLQPTLAGWNDSRFCHWVIVTYGREGSKTSARVM